MIVILGKGLFLALSQVTIRIIKLSENIYFIGGFIKCVKQRLREVVIWGTMIP